MNAPFFNQCGGLSRAGQGVAGEAEAALERVVIDEFLIAVTNHAHASETHRMAGRVATLQRRGQAQKRSNRRKAVRQRAGDRIGVLDLQTR